MPSRAHKTTWMGVVDGGRGTPLGVWPVGWLWEAIGFVSKTICGMGEGQCTCEGEGQVGHFQHPMGLGDKFCAHDIINIYNIYEGQTLWMSSWSRIEFASIKGAWKIWIFCGLL